MDLISIFRLCTVSVASAVGAETMRNPQPEWFRDPSLLVRCLVLSALREATLPHSTAARPAFAGLAFRLPSSTVSSRFALTRSGNRLGLRHICSKVRRPPRHAPEHQVTAAWRFRLLVEGDLRARVRYCSVTSPSIR